ncbi:MAG: alpha-1,2-fucosyltransferase [Bacteroidota bacterium]
MLRLMGGLGNQLFQYSTGRALAIQHNTSLKLDLSLLLDRTDIEHRVFREFELADFPIQASLASEKETAFFHPKRDTLFQKMGARMHTMLHAPRVYIESKMTYNPALSQLPNDSCLVGNFQSEQYFSKIEAILRQELTLNLPLSQQVLSLKKEMETTNSVALHVRRGDYVSNPLFSRTLGALPLEYYQRALAFLAKNLPAFKVFIFSDDPAWCRENMRLDYPFYIVADTVSGEKAHKIDMKLMGACKHYIISNSSFAWWGAWLNPDEDKIVLAPKTWYRSPEIDDRDIVPKSWHKI